MEEIEKLYTIFENGKVFSKKTRTYLIGAICKKGYRQFCLSLNGKQMTIKNHRLVAEKFIPNPENKPQINHIDGNKLNNSIENLEWVTGKENVKHAIDLGLRVALLTSTREKANEGTSRIVFNPDYGIIYDSVSDASRNLGIHRVCLSRMLRGKVRNKSNLIYA